MGRDCRGQGSNSTSSPRRSKRQEIWRRLPAPVAWGHKAESVVMSGDLRSACKVVFGPAAEAEAALSSLTHEKLRRWFRRRALDLHPDRAAIVGRTPAALAEDFKRLEGAYRVLSAHLAAERTVPAPCASPPPPENAPPPTPTRNRRTTHAAAPGARQRARREREVHPVDHFW